MEAAACWKRLQKQRAAVRAVQGLPLTPQTCLMGRARRPLLCGMQDALPEQGKAGPAVHGAFDELEFGDASFDHAV